MTKQIFTMLGGLRKAMSDLDNAIPDSAFDYDLEQSTVDAVWTEIDKVEKDFDKLQEFIEEIYEIAFGDNAINRDFSKQEVIEQIQYYSNVSATTEEFMDEWRKQK